jgi:hypothetical protein
MDLQQFLAEGPIGSLFVLMLVPVCGALLLGVFIVFSVTRRNKKTKMKLGIQSTKTNEPVIETEQGPAMAQTAEPQKMSLDDEKTTPLSGLTADGGLNMGILNGYTDDNVQQEESPVTSETVDIGARLDSIMASPSPTVSQPAEDPIELLRLLKDPQNNQLLVEIGGKRFSKLTEITNRKIGQFVLEMAAHFLVFTNGKFLSATGLQNLLRPQVNELPDPPVKTSPPQPRRSESLVPPPPPEAEAAFLASLQSLKPPASPPDPPLRRGGFLSLRPPPPSIQKLPSLNLAEEINEIVQNKLRTSQLGQTNQIELTSDTDGSLKIMVNNHIYRSPDDITDPGVRTLIKDSINEWERS